MSRSFCAGFLVAALALAGFCRPSVALADGFCQEGSDLVAHSSNDSTNREIANEAEYKAKLIEQKSRLSADERRKLDAVLPFIVKNMYQPDFSTGLKFPFISSETTDKVISVCQAGISIIIGGLRYNATLIARVCDFQKSVVNTGDSVICIVR